MALMIVIFVKGIGMSIHIGLKTFILLMLFKALYNVYIWNDHGRGHYLCYQIFDIIEFSFL